MKIDNIKHLGWVIAAVLTLGITTSCDDMLNEPLEQEVLVEQTDYTRSENMLPLLRGTYAKFNELQWETFPLISVRGDEVNAQGDQVPLIETDLFRYERSFWMYNSVWLNLYSDIFSFLAAIEQLERYKEFAPNPSVADQYIAEIKVLSAFELFQLTRLWGALLIPTTASPDGLYSAPLSDQEEVLQYISNQMDEAVPLLPAVRPNQRTDVPGGVTRYTALAVKALANLELKNYQAVADATGEIISSGDFSLFSDFYELFKIPGKLADENLLELQYSDFGQSSGENRAYLFAFFGPNNWEPAVPGASGGWGFYEPTLKYIKFMLDRDETVRLETSVLFTQQGIDSLLADPEYATLPAFVSNTTRDGDVWGRTDGQPNPRAIFSSGKHYLPSNQLTPGRVDFGTNKNFICIRYAEILLMHAEALVMGATSSTMTADEAINEVRERAGFTTPLSGVTLDDVLDEKLAELGLEWGVRFYDLVRHEQTSELNYDGRSYSANDRFLPYPLEQLDLLPQLNIDQPN